jgi:Ca-activated chloride channel homolog
VSFAAPLFLIALVAVPLLVLAYVRTQRHRGAAVAAFTTARMAPSSLPNRPGWRRHVAMAAFGLSLLVLIVAAARPQAKVTVPVKRSSVMLLIDTSASMASTDVAPTRLAAVEKAANRFLDRVPSRVDVGLMAFKKSPTIVRAPSTDRQAVRSDLSQLQAGGGTAIGTALQSTLRILTGMPPAKRPPSAIVLLSDGTSDAGIDQLTEARQSGRLHIPIYTVALGTPNGTITVHTARGTAVHAAPPSPQALAQIAQAAGGQAFTAQSSGDLSAVYDHLGTQLGHKTVNQEITASFAGVGLVLLLVGGALSLLWLRRLV